jgi:hypothetical protein
MRVVVVFCEGPHDIYFAARSVGRIGFKYHLDDAQSLPTPFGWKASPLSREEGLVLSQRQDKLDESAPEPASLTTLNFGRKPLFELASRFGGPFPDWAGPQWLMFVNMGGDSSAQRVINLARAIGTTMKRPRQDTTEVAYAFLFDADPISDKKGLDWRLREFKTAYGAWLGQSSPSDWTHGLWADTEGGRVGLWVHHDNTTRQGTLEDQLGVMFENTPSHKAATTAAKSYIDSNADAKSGVRTRADKNWKAAMTIAGQVVKPAIKGSVVGSGLSVMVEKSLPDEAFDTTYCRALASFLTSAWTNP